MEKAMTNLELQTSLASMRAMYRGGEFAKTADYAEEVLKKLLFSIYLDYYSSLKRAAQESLLGKMKELESFPENLYECDLKQFAKLMEVSKCLSKIATAQISYPLVNSFNIHQIAELVDASRNPDREVNLKLLRFATQQIIQFVTLLSYLIDAIELSEEEFLDGVQEKVSGTLNEEYAKLGYKKMFFLYNEERGLLLNRADQTRNVAFKIETFSNLLTKIYTETIQALRNQKMQNAERVAKDVIMNAGKDSGSRFGRALDQQFQKQGARIALERRIAKWCEFDSDVGFGKFSSNDIKVEKETNRVEGKITLQENFLVIGRRITDDNICCFMKGYIWGVLEELTGLPLLVKHTKKYCAQFQVGGDTCIFEIDVDPEGYKKKLEQLEQIDLEEEL